MRIQSGFEPMFDLDCHQFALSGFEPVAIIAQAAEILKDTVSWFRDCRRMEVLGTFDSTDGRIVEILHIQVYAPTTLAAPRSFYTLRYTSSLDDGSLVVCERSLNAAEGMPVLTQSQSFMHGELLSSGYLIRPYEGRGAMIIMVDHRDLDAASVPEILRPLYDSSTFFVQKMTVEASRHLQAAVQPKTLVFSEKIQQPYEMQSYSLRLCRGFNEAINTLPDDGWTSTSKEGLEDVTICMKPLLNDEQIQSQMAYVCPNSKSILCVKASLLLQGVSPTMLAHFLRDHQIEWIDCEVDFNCKTFLRESTETSGECPSFKQVFHPLILSADQDESLEVIKLGPSGQETDCTSNEVFILQLFNGMSESSVSPWAQLIFAPVDASFTDETPLLPSGFRIISINDNTDKCSLLRTLDLTSHLEDGSAACHIRPAGGANICCSSVLTVAFQFKCEAQTRDVVAVKAHQHAQGVLEFVKKAAVLILPTCTTPQTGMKQSVCRFESKLLIHHIVQKYRSLFGTDLFKTEAVNSDILFRIFWNHRDAIICFSWKHILEYIFANQAGLDMLETTAASLPELQWIKTITENEKETTYKSLSQVMQLGYSYMPTGIRLSSKGRAVAYERAVAWKVLEGKDNAQIVAVMFMNWSFLTCPGF